MLDPGTVITVLALYMGFLFLTALWVERRSPTGRNPVNNPVVYSLSLAVYCTGWTYYGSVGLAANYGLLFLTIYLGPTISIVMWWTILRKLVRIKSDHHITSIADFISARYNKSQSLAALATLIALTGTTPYIALQFKAVISTFGLITSSQGTSTSWVSQHVGPVLLALMCVFTIILGIRRLDPTERHPGLIMAVAAECLVKLVAFLAAGVFVTYFMFDGFGDILTRMSANMPTSLVDSWEAGHLSPITWTTYLVLAMSAIMFLPRQFHVSVVENFDEQHVRTAMWMFPTYMLLINIFVFPIAIGGLLHGYSAAQADTFVLQLPMDSGHKWLSVLVFLGGGSAATAMIMISSITVSTMLTNHLLLPAIDWIPSLAFLRRHLLRCRWVAAASVIVIGYWFELQVGESYMLVNIGLISFVAALQFAPVILLGIFWQRGNQAGALLGLASGFMVWIYTLLIPAFVRSGWISDSLVRNGPFGIWWLGPEQFLGVTTLDHLTHAVFWSMVFNLGMYMVGSLLFRQSREEQSVAKDFVSSLQSVQSMSSPIERESYIDLAGKVRTIERLLGQYYSEAETESITTKCLQAAGIEGNESISIVQLAELNAEVEKILAGSVGAAQARRALDAAAIFMPHEARDLSEVYAEILANLKVTPDELKRKIDYYQEREALLTHHAAELEQKVKERTEDLEAAQNELIKAEKLTVLGKLTAIVSHELRNPLGVIRSSAYYLDRKFSSGDEKTKKHLTRIEKQVELCDTIIGELLEYTRGKRSEVTEGRINQCLENLLEEWPHRGLVPVTRNLAPDLPLVHFDEERIRRVVLNLLDNALQAVQAREATEAGGRFRPTIEVSTRVTNATVSIIVSDNGMGMDRRTADRAFEPLFTTKARGTGLGLAVVKKIVEEHGGSVSLFSSLGKGVTVEVRLPVDASSENAAHDMTEPERRNRR